MKIIKKHAYFNDDYGNEHHAIIRINEGVYIGINSFINDDIPTAYMYLFFHPNNRLFLETIYCYDEFRNMGIATIISELVDYILKDYNSFVIRGVYDPNKLLVDRDNNIEIDQKTLEKEAKNFYKKAGYKIIKYKDYLKNKEKYNYLNEDDFIISEEGPTTIVAKLIESKKYPFYEENGFICYNNFKR